MKNKISKPIIEKADEFKIKTVHFIHNTPIFLNYLNKVSHKDYNLIIKNNYLYINNAILIPLSNILSIEL